MKNWGWVTIFQHVKKGGPGKIMHCVRGGSWLNYSFDSIYNSAKILSECLKQRF